MTRNGVFGFPEYDDPIVIRFEIPWLSAPGNAEGDAGRNQPGETQAELARVEHASPDGHQNAQGPDHASASWPPPRIIMANVKGYSSPVWEARPTHAGTGLLFANEALWALRLGLGGKLRTTAFTEPDCT